MTMLSQYMFGEVLDERSVEDGTEVDVIVGGMKSVRGTVKDVRARTYAVYTAGPTDVARKSLDNITAGEVERFSTIEDKELVTDEDMIDEVFPIDLRDGLVNTVEAYRYTILVNKE